MSTESPTNAKSLKQKTLEGFGWSGLNRVGKQLIQFAISVVLARLLFPRDYGLVGMAAVFIGMGRILADLGFGGAIVQRKDLTSAQLSSIFWLNLGTGATLWVIAWMCAPLIARFYSTPEVAPIVVVSSFSFVLATASAVPRALIYKAMGFRELFVLDWSGVLLGGGASIVAAMAGLEYWSLVLGNLVSPFFATVLAWKFCAWRPTLQLSLAGLRDVTEFSNYYLGFQLVQYVTGNIDYLIIGRFFSAAELGIYTIAFRLVEIPRQQLGLIIQSVLYPVFVAVQEEPLKLKIGVRKTLVGVSVLVFPVLVGLVVVAHDFINVVYGPKWADVAGLLQLLVPVGLVYSLEVATPLLLSKGGARAVFFVTLGRALLLAGVLYVAATWKSLALISILVSAVAVLTGIPYQLWACRGVGLEWREILVALAPASTLSCVMALGVFVMSRWLQCGNFNGLWRLLVEVAVGCGIYLGGSFVWPWGELAEVRDDVLARRRIS